MKTIKLFPKEELHEITENFNQENYQYMRMREIKLDGCTLFETPYMMAIEPNWGDNKAYIRLLINREIYYEPKRMTIDMFL